MHPAPPASVPDTVFVEGSGKAFNTVPPSDFGFFELMNEVVQNEPAGSTDPELMGQLAAIGIVKGQPFEPDERMRRTLEEAAAVGDATSRALFLNYRDSEGFGYYDEDSAWFNMLWVGGYTFETPPPLVTADGIEPLPATGVRTLHSRTSFLYAATVVSPAMCMRLTDIGSQYLMAVRDADGERLDGGKNYRMTLPHGHPGGAVLVGDPLRQPDPVDARRRLSDSRVPGASPTRPRRRPPTPTARRPSRSVRSDRPTALRATGSRPRRARAGSRSCASTARSSRSSTRAGSRARSRRRLATRRPLRPQATTQGKGSTVSAPRTIRNNKPGQGFNRRKH